MVCFVVGSLVFEVSDVLRFWGVEGFLRLLRALCFSKVLEVCVSWFCLFCC